MSEPKFPILLGGAWVVDASGRAVLPPGATAPDHPRGLWKQRGELEWWFKFDDIEVFDLEDVKEEVALLAEACGALFHVIDDLEVTRRKSTTGTMWGRQCCGVDVKHGVPVRLRAVDLPVDDESLASVGLHHGPWTKCEGYHLADIVPPPAPKDVALASDEGWPYFTMDSDGAWSFRVDMTHRSAGVEDAVVDVKAMLSTMADQVEVVSRRLRGGT